LSGFNEAYRKFNDRPNARQTNRKWIGWIRDYKWQERADTYDQWVNQGTEAAIAQVRERSLIEAQGYFNRLNRLISRDLDVDEGMAELLESFIVEIKKVPPLGAGYGNRLLANRWFPLQVYIFRPKGRGIIPILD
jgi:hypothetical protein